MKNAPRPNIARIQVERSKIIFEGICTLPVVGHRRPNAVIQQPVLRYRTIVKKKRDDTRAS